MMPPSSFLTDSLRIATEHYYWKPGKALFHAVQVEEYARTGVCFEHPVMDLGCGNGAFSEILQERGILDSVDVALDYSAKDLWRVKRNVVYGVIQGDARDLPLKGGTIASVLANDSLSSMTTDVSRALSEIYRVLSNQGLFVLTVPVRFNEARMGAKVLRRIGASRLATRYVEYLNRRLLEYQRFDEEGWLKKLQERHFHIEQVRRYFTPRQAFWGDLLGLQIFRVFAFLKIMRVGWLRRGAARIEEKMFRSVFVEEQFSAQKPDGTFRLLVVARKMS
jgi:SAM-dependent methyltransferase